MINEQSAIEAAKVFYEQLLAEERNRQNRHLELLKEEESYFCEAMILQSAAFPLIMNHFPFENRKSFASIALSFSLFDHLRRGWQCIIEGYYLVSMTIARNIFEGILFQTAIGVGLAAEFKEGAKENVDFIDQFLSKWWADKLKPGTIAHLIAYIEKELKQRFGGEILWARRTRATWKLLAGWAHANWAPVGMSGIRVNYKNQQDIPALSYGGGLFNPDLCKLLGNLYAYFSVEATFALGLAFLPELHSYKEWCERKDRLVAKHQEWVTRVDFLQRKDNR